MSVCAPLGVAKIVTTRAGIAIEGNGKSLYDYREDGDDTQQLQWRQLECCRFGNEHKFSLQLAMTNIMTTRLVQSWPVQLWPVQLWIAAMLCLAANSVASAGELLRQYQSLPPEVRPGECYAKVIVPAIYSESQQTVVKREASESISIVPARFEWTEERVMVKEASELLTVVPATYRWVEETVLIEPVTFRLEPVAAVYEMVTEQILDTPEYQNWTTQCGPLQHLEHMTGDVMCLVSEPATYKTITRYIVSEPATTRRVQVPAKYKKVRRQVLDTPARVVSTPQPARFETIRVRKMVSPARVERAATPVEYQTVTRKEKLSDEHFAWYQVVCGDSLDSRRVRDLQQALKKHGYDPGEIDGVSGSRTMKSVEAFQSDRELARGALTLETLDALGLEF